jgi:HlyD family secretion protein
MATLVATVPALAGSAEQAPAPAQGKPKGKSGLRRRKLGWLWWLVAVAGLAIGAQRVLALQRVKVLPARVHVVALGTVRDLVSSATTGQVAAEREVSLRAEIAGTVAVRHHKRGDKVQKGEPLITYDPKDLRDRLRAAQATVLVGRAQAAQAEEAARLAKDTAERTRRLERAGAAPPAQADELEGQANVAARAAQAAGRAVEQMVTSVELARTALSKTVVRAPFAATVITTHVEEGDVTLPGSPLFALADTSVLHVDVDLDEADLGRVRVGMPAEVSFDALPDERLLGTLTEIAPSVTHDLRNTRTVAVRVDLKADPRFIVGMSADVDVVVATRESALSVPPNAVLGRGTDRAVLVVEQGVARRRPIEVGISTWESVEILKGVRAGEEVVVTLSSADMKDGARVDVQRDDHGANAHEGASR